MFNSPSEEANEKEYNDDLEGDIRRRTNQNHCTEVDITIPIDQRVGSPKGRVQIQGRTSDLYEIISPRSTPFRVKKRLGKISVEESVKPESFTLGSKVDCRSVVAQKRTKCFPYNARRPARGRNTPCDDVRLRSPLDDIPGEFKGTFVRYIARYFFISGFGGANLSEMPL